MSQALLSHAVTIAASARRTAGRARRGMEQLRTVPAFGGSGRGRPSLRPIHLSVIGGGTLNIAVPLPPGAEAPEEAYLQVERRNESRRVPLEVEPQWEGPTLLTATTALRHPRHDGPERPGLDVGDGLWQLTVVLVHRSGTARRFAVLAPPAPVSTGPTLASSPSGGSGAVFRVMRSLDGLAMLKVTAPRAQAELTGFTVRWDRVTVRGRLIATAVPPASFTAEAVPRAGGAAVPVWTDWQGDRFTFDVPFSAMTGAMAEGRKAAQRWDLRLRHGRTTLDIGRRLTDVRNPHKVLRTTFRTLALEDGTLLRVHPHLTGAGKATVNCTIITTIEDGTR
ncbi:hypothetical protein AB0C59_07660 [Streptomyces sp. NPDC048664]|uniref:hypothetical protein n=1 Tax=Streptomyces sp. NPDC048664 TaxID=3154505 RepID=UPI00343D3238